MAESGIGASVSSVAGTGFSLSLVLNAVGCSTSNAPAELHTISKRINTYSLTLEQIGTVLARAESVYSDGAVATARTVLDESGVVFEEINIMLQRLQTGQNNTLSLTQAPHKIRWTFKQHQVDYLLSRMDRLLLSSQLMLQIMQLGASMATTSIKDPPERVQRMSDAIRRERMVAQNTVMLYHTGDKEVDRLYATAKEEEYGTQLALKEKEDEESLELVPTNSSTSTAVEVLPLCTQEDLFAHPPPKLITNDEHWNQMDKSPEDMVRVSETVINQLLERWTRWREERESREKARSGRTNGHNGRFQAEVHDARDDDGRSAYQDRFHERDASPVGRYLEGPTVDWRQPHSNDARARANKLRKAYAGYQPSVSAPNSDQEDSPNSRGSGKRAPRRHVIDSSDESSASEAEKSPRRDLGSTFSNPAKHKPRLSADSGMSSTSQSFKSNTPPSTLKTSIYNPANRGLPPSPVTAAYPHRPYTSPNQHPVQHAFSQPPPLAHQSHSNLQQVTTNPPVQSPGVYAPRNGSQLGNPYFPQQPSSQYPASARLTPQASRQSTQRPVSRDGLPSRSPSRLPSSNSQYHRPPPTADDRRHSSRKKERRKFGDTAARSLLAGGSIAVILDALDAF